MHESSSNASTTAEVICAGILVADFFPSAIEKVPEPGQLLPIQSIGLFTGGCAANTGVALAKLGVSVTVAGAVGDDTFGDFIIQDIGRRGLDVSGVVRSSDYETSKTIILTVKGEDRRYLHLFGANASFSASDIDIEHATADVLYVGGFLGMARMRADDLAEVFANAKNRGMATVLDVIVPAPGDYTSVFCTILPFVDVFLPNADEGTLITGEPEPRIQAKAFHEMGADTVVITQGSMGVIATSGNELVEAGCFSVRHIDGSGAGDAFAAGYIAAMLRDSPLDTCIKTASAMGASCVREMGCSAGLFDQNELDSFLSTHELEVRSVGS